MPTIAHLTSADDMDFGSIGDTPTAIFCVISDSDTSLNYLVSMMYTQAIQTLYYKADHSPGGRLKVPVRLILDEFNNVPVPGGTGESGGFSSLLSTMRGRDISAAIIVQNIAQIKNKFRDPMWEEIVGNCDSLLFLGGNEQSKFISDLLGKATIDTRSNSQSHGTHGSYSTNNQQIGRELLTPDEVRRMDNDYCLLFIRGEQPVMDKKYDLRKHRNYKSTEDGGAAPYVHTPVCQSAPCVKMSQGAFLEDGQ